MRRWFGCIRDVRRDNATQLRAPERLGVTQFVRSVRSCVALSLRIRIHPNHRRIVSHTDQFAGDGLREDVDKDAAICVGDYRRCLVCTIRRFLYALPDTGPCATRLQSDQFVPEQGILREVVGEAPEELLRFFELLLAE